MYKSVAAISIAVLAVAGIPGAHAQPGSLAGTTVIAQRDASDVSHDRLPAHMARNINLDRIGTLHGAMQGATGVMQVSQAGENRTPFQGDQNEPNINFNRIERLHGATVGTWVSDLRNTKQGSQRNAKRGGQAGEKWTRFHGDQEEPNINFNEIENPSGSRE